uniref:D-3-phosphoglycerate dehydrogenase n=1 Tax=uncultured Armatimonadetes bacterium TaxID=157466 RepID=A0A6J4J4L0_9BACT|nr:D-3-phosphoglycerate dehydrogenase [uncultured Armatimonadetes bacterium]
MPKLRLLVNLPAGFHTAPVLKPVYRRLAAMGTLRRRSHNTADEIAADLAWADAVLMWSWPVLTGEMLQRAPRLQFCGHLDITQRGARALLERGLPVSVSRRGFSPAVSEMALTLILSTLRKTAVHQAAMRAGSETWVARFPDDIDPDERELTGRPVGIIGFGAVGQGLADLLAPFRCELRVYDPFLPDGVEERWGAGRTDLPTLIESSDVVVLCAASNAGTRHLLGRAEVRRFRRGAVLVNVARAALVDTAALAARLERNDLYAAVDVFDKEPLEADSALRRLPNAFLTPHRAGGVLASVERIVGFLADDLEAHLEGRPRAHALTEAMLPSLDA